MSKHTPGPWWAAVGGVRHKGGYIAHTNIVLRNQGQDERYALEVAQRDADKRLIAAAPDLLEALKGLVCALENGVWGMAPDTLMETEMRAAIAKATGETA